MNAEATEEFAARWLVRREEPGWSPEDERAFAVWMNESMANRAAFWRLEHGWRLADPVDALYEIAAAPTNRLPLWRRLPNVNWTVAAGAIAATVILGLCSLLWLHAPDAERPNSTAYQTARGGRGTIRLGDGSKVELNTATSLRAGAAPDAREVWLDRGEAYFDIVHRPDRRFVVHAGPQTITVLGTRFSVRREGASVTVAVLSGRVRVEDSNAMDSGRAALVGRGDVAIARDHATLVASATVDKVEAMTAWRDGMLMFDATPLGDAVAEFNRYNSIPIRIPDPSLRQLRIGGSFQTRDASAFLDLLHTAYGLRVERTAKEIDLHS